MCYTNSIDKTKGHKTMTNKELNDYGFNIKRTEDLTKAIVEAIKANNPYVEEVKGSTDGYINVTFKSLALVNGGEHKETITFSVNGTAPTKKDPFVPVWHTAQIDLCTLNNGEYTSTPEPSSILYPYLKGRLIHAKSVFYSCYDFGLYSDEGGKGELKRIAESVSNDICKLISEYYLPYVENRINEFKYSLK